MNSPDRVTFNYLEHYKTDAEKFDYFEERTGATEHDERRLREYIISQVPNSVHSILDVGCGSAWVANAFLPKEKFVCSLDATIVNTSKALEKYPSHNHTAVVADAFHLPFKDGAFDCVIASEIIEHVTDPAAFVAELTRVLKHNGTLLISTPYKETLVYYLCIHCNEMTPRYAHIHSFDEKKLESYIDSKSASFKWKTFGNKILIFLRTYTLLKFLPFGMWKFVDAVFNKLYNKPAHILVSIEKR